MVEAAAHHLSVNLNRLSFGHQSKVKGQHCVRNAQVMAKVIRVEIHLP